MQSNKQSPEAAKEFEAVQPNNGDCDLDHPLALVTDCPHGCSVEDAAEPCPHGWLSAARTLGWT